MIELGIQERSAISALQWLPVEGIRAQYAEYLKDCEGCNRIEILRAIVIYRIQEKFYGRRVSRETERLMEKAVEGDKLLHAPADDVRSSRRKLVRNWKGIWTGGVIPYGYKSIDSELIPDSENAPKVLYAFQRFAITRSYLETSRELNEKYGNHHADKRWNVMHVRTLLNMAWPVGRVRDTKTGELFEGQHEAIVPFELWLTVQREIESRRKGHQTARSESSAPLKGLLKCGYCGCAMIPTYSGKKVPGRGTFLYYRCNNTHKHVTEECQLKNISGAAIEEPVFNLIERLITNEYFFSLVNPENVPIIVRLARARKMIEMLSSGTYKNKQEIGDMFGMSQAQVSRPCRSAFLSRGPLRAATPCLRHLPFELRSSAHRDHREDRLGRNPVHALRRRVRQAYHASPLGRATRASGD